MHVWNSMLVAKLYLWTGMVFKMCSLASDKGWLHHCTRPHVNFESKFMKIIIIIITGA